MSDAVEYWFIINIYIVYSSRKMDDIIEVFYILFLLKKVPMT